MWYETSSILRFAVILSSIPLQAAAEGQTKVVEFLIISKANVNPKDRFSADTCKPVRHA